MKSLTIKDLSITEELDSRAMSAVRGGNLPSFWPGYSSTVIEPLVQRCGTVDQPVAKHDQQQRQQRCVCKRYLVDSQADANRQQLQHGQLLIVRRRQRRSSGLRCRTGPARTPSLQVFQQHSTYPE